MNKPFPWLMRSAEVRISGSVVAVSAHGLTVRCPLSAVLAAAIWEQLGVQAGKVSVHIQGEAAKVWLTWDGLKVEIGPYTINRVLQNDRWYNFLKSRQEIEMEYEMAVA